MTFLQPSLSENIALLEWKFMLPLLIGGIAAVPFIGFLLDSTSTVVVLSLLVFLSTTIGILGALPFFWAAYTTLFFSFCRKHTPLLHIRYCYFLWC